MKLDYSMKGDTQHRKYDKRSESVALFANLTFQFFKTQNKHNIVVKH